MQLWDGRDWGAASDWREWGGHVVWVGRRGEERDLDLDGKGVGRELGPWTGRAWGWWWVEWGWWG